MGKIPKKGKFVWLKRQNEMFIKIFAYKDWPKKLIFHQRSKWLVPLFFLQYFSILIPLCSISILMNGAPHAGILHSFCRNAKKGYTSAFMLLVSTSSRLSSPYFLGPKKVEEMKKYGQSKRKPPFSSFLFQIHTPSTLKTFFVSLWTFFKFSSYLYISQTSSSRRPAPTAFKF